MKDFWVAGLQDQRKGKLKKLAILICCVLILLAITSIVVIYIYNLDFRIWCDKNVLRKEISQKDTKSIELDGDENTQIYAYDKYICLFRKKKLQFYNKLGNQIEEIDLDINKAVFTSAGRYMAICEAGGQKFYLICGKEKVFESEVNGNINQIKVSRSGYVAVVMTNSSYKSIIDVYNRSGKQIFKKNIVTSRVADISISQDSKYIAIAEIDISGILIKSSIQVISVDLAQEKPNEATIYQYSAKTDKLILNIEYQEQEKLLCMYDDSIEVLEGNQSKEIINIKNNKPSFMSINFNNRIAILEEISKGDYTSDTHINLISPITQKSREYVVEDVTKSIVTVDGKLAMNCGTDLYVINSYGILLKKYVSDKEISDVVMTNSIVGIVYRDKIQIIVL